jgi:CDP-glycerol glycerophosphotransferase (TagB/SpsB family)
LREADISWTVGERDDRSVCVMGTDRMRGLVGLACLSPEDAAGRFFLRNGRACSPVFQKRFPLRFMPGQTTFLNILWFAANERDTFTASIDGQPASFMRRPHANRDGATHGEGDAVLRMRQLLSPKGRLPGLRHRVISFLARLPFVRRHYEDAWLFVDRDFKADDNAEHLYRWVMRRHPEQKLYFALDKHSQDWQRLRQEGFRLLDFRSLRYYFTWLHCSWLISSNRTDYILQSKWRRWYADIIKHQCCFLQHGVTMSHQSSMNSPHLDMLITAAPAEYRAFAEDPQYQYVYSSRETQLTGLPRHDALLGKAAAQANPRRILIMPTWRGRLAADLVPGTGRRAYSPDFCRSDFFHQWQAVLSSPALHEIARRYGYHLVFYPHPYLRQQMRDFRFTGVELLPDVGGSIQDVISNAALLLTDYSSISLEFAQIRRPVLYFQFDRDSFYQGQPFSQGYFNYERDGFGPIAETVDELCALTEACLRGGCHMPEVYRRRAENFFAFADQNNCRRVYDAIIMASRAVDEKPEARP